MLHPHANEELQTSAEFSRVDQPGFSELASGDLVNLTERYSDGGSDVGLNAS